MFFTHEKHVCTYVCNCKLVLTHTDRAHVSFNLGKSRRTGVYVCHVCVSVLGQGHWQHRRESIVHAKRAGRARIPLLVHTFYSCVFSWFACVAAVAAPEQQCVLVYGVMEERQYKYMYQQENNDKIYNFLMNYWNIDNNIMFQELPINCIVLKNTGQFLTANWRDLTRILYKLIIKHNYY